MKRAKFGRTTVRFAFFILREKNLKLETLVFPILFHELYHTIFRMFSVSWHDTKQNFACFNILQNDTKRNFARFLFHKTWKMSWNTNFFIILLFCKIKFNAKNEVLLILSYSPHNPLFHFPPFTIPSPLSPFPHLTLTQYSPFIPSCPDIIKKLWKKLILKGLSSEI